MNFPPKRILRMEIVRDPSEGQACIKIPRQIHPKEVTFRDLLTPRILSDEEPAGGRLSVFYKCGYHCVYHRSSTKWKSNSVKV